MRVTRREEAGRKSGSGGPGSCIQKPAVPRAGKHGIVGERSRWLPREGSGTTRGRVTVTGNRASERSAHKREDQGSSRWSGVVGAWRTSENLGYCGRMVFRHGAILLFVRRRSGISLDAVDNGDEVLGSVQAECGREEVNDGEKQEKDKTRRDRQRTDDQTHIVEWHEDGMTRAYRHVGWLVLSHAM